MAQQEDYYRVLEVSATCTVEELKSAYRKKAMKFHPDRNPDDSEAEARFKVCAEAYSVLSDQEKRRVYDQYGHDGLNGQGFSGFNGSDDIFSSFGDIFGDLFGFSRRGGSRRGVAGADLRYDMTISFEQAVFGDEIELTIPRMAVCQDCGGSGAEPGTSSSPCPDCQGRGQVYRSQGFLRIATTCPTCNGEGRIVDSPCPACFGHGRIREEAQVKVRVPAGVDTGARLRLRGEGESGSKGGPNGDLYVILSVEEHEFFHREDDHLIYVEHINIAQAALGLEIEVPTLNDPHKLKIPAGVQPGKVFRLRSKGVPHLRGPGSGDLLVQILVDTPTKMTARQKELLAEFDEIEQSRGEGGLFNGLKKMADKVSGRKSTEKTAKTAKAAKGA